LSNKNRLFALSAVSTLLTFVSATGSAQADTASQAAGESLLQQAVQTLQSSTALSADFEEIDSYPTNYKDLAQRGRVVVSQPGQLRIDIHRYRRVSAADPWVASGNDTTTVSDGKTYSYAFLHPHSSQVRQSPAAPEIAEKALQSVAPLGGYFSKSPEASLPRQAGTAEQIAPATWEGASYQVVQYTAAVRGRGAAPSATAYIGQDRLIHRLIYRTQTPRGTVTKEWNLRNVQVNQAVPATVFAFTSPPDATPLIESPKSALLEAGSIAPDFTVYDPQGKPVKLSDYKGKTVVLDFWATWCWPCNQSLPHTEEIARRYRDKNVVALAVAIRDSKAGFDSWLTKHDFPDLRFLYAPQVQGEDVAATLYHVEATPTTYVIDANGKIVSSLVGYSGPSPELASAVDLAQSTKTASAH